MTNPRFFNQLQCCYKFKKKKYSFHLGYGNVVHLLINKDANVNILDKEGETQLHKAARKGIFCLILHIQNPDFTD